MTDEERQQFKHEVVEEVLRSLPVVIHSLVARSAQLKGLSDDFYKDNPRLKNNKQLVAKTMEEIESNHPGISYEDLLKQVKPLVESKLQTMEGIATKPRTKPSLEDVDHLLDMFEVKQ